MLTILRPFMCEEPTVENTFLIVNNK